MDLPGPHVITGVQSQGRYDRGRGQEYVEEYTLEYRRPGFTDWRRYKRWDKKEVREHTFIPWVVRDDTASTVEKEWVESDDPE